MTVKLLQDVKTFGRKGSYIPISPAQMRNRWFPKRIADYVPPTQLRELKQQHVTMERDFDFGVEHPSQEEKGDEVKVQPTYYVRPVEINLLSPERSTELISVFVPSTIDFHRQPIEPDTAHNSEDHQGASDAADILTAALAASAKPISKPGATGIYGSVSTADVASTIKALLKHNDEAARVILTEQDIRFVDGLIEGETTRVKHLGRFTVEIRVNGAKEPIKRTVRVRAN